MKFRNAFTLIELVFVIVVIGIIGKFGVEFLAQAYKGFIFTNVNNTLQTNSATAVEFISTRLQHRIKDSIIKKKDSGEFVALGSADNSPDYTILEWVGADIDGLRGNSDTGLPAWSGVIDLDLSSKTTIVSPATNTTEIDELITILSGGGSSIDDAALYFVGSSSDITTGYGWNGAINDQNKTMHPINAGVNTDEFISANSNSFSELYEYYQLAWSAYAVVMENYDATTKMGTLVLYYDYQPWNGDTYHNGKPATIMENVSSFQFMAIGSLVKIQVCAKSKLVEEYSLCKEKTIY